MVLRLGPAVTARHETETKAAVIDVLMARRVAMAREVNAGGHTPMVHHTRLVLVLISHIRPARQTEKQKKKAAMTRPLLFDLSS